MTNQKIAVTDPRATTATMLEAALDLARAGYPVFPLWGIEAPAPADVVAEYLKGPKTREAKASAQAHALCKCGDAECRSPGKHPREKGIKDATTDAAQIKRWFKTYPDANIGIRMPPGFVAIDQDRIEGAAERVAGLPPTLTQTSGLGSHRIYSGVPDDFVLGSTLDGTPGVDLIHHDLRYLVAAPSMHWTGTQYMWKDGPDNAAAIPPSVLARCTRGLRGPSKVKALGSRRFGPAPPDRFSEQCPAGVDPKVWARVLAVSMPPAISDDEPESTEHGHVTLKRAAGSLIAGLELGEAYALNVLWTHYNPRCVPPWDEDERADFDRTVRGAGAGLDAGYLLPKVIEPPSPHAPAADSTRLGQAIDLSTPIQKLRYLCEGLGIAFDGKCAAVHGYAGSSKGLFMSLIALCVASGKPVFGVHPVTRVPVVYGDAETGVLAEIRLKRLALTLGIDLGELMRDGWFRFHRLTHQLTDVMGDLEAACRAANKGEGCAVALDSYSSLVAGDENKSEYADPMWELGRMGSRVNAVPIVTMHERKGDRDAKGGRPNPLEGISGTNRLAAALATSIRLTPSEADDKVITVTCTRAPETRFAPIELTWADEGEGLAAHTAHKTILTQAEISERKAVDKQGAQAQALAERIATAERAIVFRLAAAEPAPDASQHTHMRPERSLTASQLAKAAGVHPSRQGDGEAPAILQRLVIEGWLRLVEVGRYDAYQLAAALPKEPRRFGHQDFSVDGGRHRGLMAEIQRGRAVGARP